jgi:hypothetical protein
MSLSKKSSSGWMAVYFLLASVGAFSQVGTADSSAHSVSISEQLNAINNDKKQVLENFDERSKACWKIFAVNDCLAKARQLKYQQLAPLDQREYELNAQQRALKEIERRKRLADKEPHQN